MKNLDFDGIKIPADSVSSELNEVLELVSKEEYGDAFQLIEFYISNTEDVEPKNIVAMIFLQILAIAGYNELASVLLSALLEKFKRRSKARYLCKETIKFL